MGRQILPPSPPPLTSCMPNFYSLPSAIPHSNVVPPLPLTTASSIFERHLVPPTNQSDPPTPLKMGRQIPRNTAPPTPRSSNSNNSARHSGHHIPSIPRHPTSRQYSTSQPMINPGSTFFPPYKDPPSNAHSVPPPPRCAHLSEGITFLLQYLRNYTPPVF